MDPVIMDTDPQLDAAMAQLESDMAADAAGSQAAATTTTESAIPAQPAPVQPKSEGVEPPKADAKPGAPATAESKSPVPEPSKYEKAAARQETAWKQINTEKEEVRSLRKQLEDQSTQLKRDREAFDAERAKSAQPKHKPEDYESYAQQCEKQAADLEAAGKFDDAAIAKYKAAKAKEYATELRNNPPPAPKTDEQAKAEQQKLEKEWYGKGGIDYPQAAKQGTPENNALLKLLEAEPGLLKDPKAMYYGLRLVTSETVAARVPSLEKDLGDARAKIKELEGKLAVPDGGAPAGNMAPLSFEQKSSDEQYAELESMAKGMG